MDGDTKIIEMMPDDVSDEVHTAMAEGRLCRYALELESQLDAAKEEIKKLKEITSNVHPHT